jgi:hypothetical protein
MFFRFGSAVVLVVLISLVGIAIEKQNLHQRRELSRQHYQMDVLRDEHTRLRLRCQSLASIERLFESVDGNHMQVTPRDSIQTDVQQNADPSASPTTKQKTNRRVPLLFFQQPLHDPRLKRRKAEPRNFQE